MFYAADFFERGRLTKAEWRALRDDVACPSLAPSFDAYIAELEDAGFHIMDAVDATEDWTVYTRQRVETTRAQRAELVPVLGEGVFDSLLQFYELIAGLFAGGHLGGIEVYAQRPRGW